jgi:YggT family protein
MSPVVNALVFLINAAFGLYTLLVVLRFLLFMHRAPMRDAPSQLILKLTNPPLKALYSFIPRFQNIDLAALVLIFALELLKLLLTLLLYGQYLNLFGLLGLALVNILSLFIYVYIFSIIIQAILSFVTPPDHYNPINEFLYRLNEPLLQPMRNLIPPIQGFDLSPLFVILGLQLIIILLVDPIRALLGL